MAGPQLTGSGLCSFRKEGKHHTSLLTELLFTLLDPTQPSVGCTLCSYIYPWKELRCIHTHSTYFSFLFFSGKFFVLNILHTILPCLFQIQIPLVLPSSFLNVEQPHSKASPADSRTLNILCRGEPDLLLKCWWM